MQSTITKNNNIETTDIKDLTWKKKNETQNFGESEVQSKRIDNAADCPGCSFNCNTIMPSICQTYLESGLKYFPTIFY